jgi:hypothetical protein
MASLTRKDDSLRTAQNLGNLTNSNQTRRNNLSKTDRQDFLSFSLSSSSQVGISLTRLKANASLQLLTATGSPIITSNRKGNRSESIQQTLAAGAYTIKVSLRKGSTRYQLQLSATTTTPSPISTPIPAPTPTVLPVQEWIRQIPTDNPANETKAFNYAGKLTIDSFGNTYVSGYSNSPIAGGAEAGFFDAWFAKYSNDGTQQWVKRIATDKNDYIQGLVTDTQGNLYLSGATNSDAPNRAGAFVAKYDSNGNQIWIDNTLKSDKPGDIPEARDIAVDRDGNLYITGITFGSLGGADNGSFDAWIAKYQSNGTRLWIRQLGTAGFDTATSVVVDSTGNAYIGGTTPGSLGGTYAGGSGDAWIAKYNTSGDRLWVRQFGTSGITNEEVQGIAIDRSDNLYLTGRASGVAGSIWSENKPWIVKYTPNGDLQWSKQYGTVLTDSLDIATDANNNLYTVGRTQDFFGSTTGSWNAYFAKFDPNGDNLWGELLTTPSEDRAYNLVVDSNNKIYVMGTTGGSLGRVNSRTPVFDVWLAKYNSP